MGKVIQWSTVPQFLIREAEILAGDWEKGQRVIFLSDADGRLVVEEGIFFTYALHEIMCDVEDISIIYRYLNGWGREGSDAGYAGGI